MSEAPSSPDLPLPVPLADAQRHGQRVDFAPDAQRSNGASRGRAGASPTSSTTRGPLYLTVPEAAALLRTTPKGIRRMIEDGKLTSAVRRLDRRVLLSYAALVALVESSAPSSGGTR